jgi:transcriptional/translational regulatory protein YebC/TACO1
MGSLLGNIGSIRNIISALTGNKKRSTDTVPVLAVTGGLLGITGVMAYLTNKRMQKLGGYIP